MAAFASTYRSLGFDDLFFVPPWYDIHGWMGIRYNNNNEILIKLKSLVYTKAWGTLHKNKKISISARTILVKKITKISRIDESVDRTLANVEPAYVTLDYYHLLCFTGPAAAHKYWRKCKVGSRQRKSSHWLCLFIKHSISHFTRLSKSSSQGRSDRAWWSVPWTQPPETNPTDSEAWC